MLSNNDYELRVSYTYDLNDGLGNRIYRNNEIIVKTLEELFLYDYGFIIQNGEIIDNGVNKASTLYINIPIADYAFSGLNNIEHVVFGKNVTYIGERAFYQTWDLKTVTFLSEEPPVIGLDVFGYRWGGRIKVLCAYRIKSKI